MLLLFRPLGGGSRMAAKNSRPYDDRAKQQQYAQHVGVQYGIAKENPDQAEAGAGRAEGEVKPFPGAAREAQQNQQHGGDNHVDRQQDDSGSRFLAANGERFGPRDGQLHSRDAEEEHGVYQRDDGALAVIDDGEAVHKHAFSLPYQAHIWL